MTYAITYHSGYDKATQRIQTKATTPPIRRVRKLDETNKGRKRNPQGQTAICTITDATNGFLKTSFLPKLAETKTAQACKKTASLERDFYQSLSKLATHYNINPIHTQSFGFPYKIALALWNTKEKLKDKVRDWEEIKLVQDNNKTFFTSEERYNTNSTLYYIPVVPLYRLLKNKKRKHSAQLLLSVCSYLYHNVNIPYYRQGNSFLYYQYEMLKEWQLTDDDAEETSIYLREFEQAEYIGDKMEQKIFNTANLTFFKKRLNRFKGTEVFEQDCLKLAQEAYSLLEQYPNENVFRNARPNEEADENEEEIENILTMDYYVSFYADGKGWLNENIIQCVNNELQEYGQIEEPSILKRFDGSDITINNLDFENRLFALIGQLIYLLNNF
ncbi:hypothetical protein [Flavobacterium undicola]|uniref:hypothetical protein n=1 Tax=Flavobacterium undicola TaxID=1932779 RepID=UPI00137737A2|nr:hypothetical protein [Flavobacterium undicola]MBA0885525.1 hypothetical protein [Flavobacterium undicola]